MAGNVSEWVSDWFDPEYYQRNLSDNPTGPSAGELKVFRGGSWNEDPEVARSAGRNAGRPDRKSYLTGLRCARSERDSLSVKREAQAKVQDYREVSRVTNHEKRFTNDGY
jgi:iron(II)-dependent oxidoreductase